MDRHYLYPGAIFASKKPHIVDTILGSCVAVILLDPVLKFGSINHYMLPNWNGEGTASNKYGDIAIPALIKEMLTLGSSKSDLKAKIFGGGEVGPPNGVFHIGERNTEFAIELLKKERIPILSHDTGGSYGRKLVFYSESGEVMLRYIKQISTADQI